ncbi:MAG: efflux RND transporter periplasmic adaptor subunit [Rhodobacterales bacterium]|nr:efflux RND transporter periplasmic adaptor subunit [Rhodobacterales bacterium]
MRRILPILAGIGALITFMMTLGFLFWKSQEPPEVFETEQPFTSDIILKTVATGAIVPRNEVAIKSRVSGVVQTIDVDPGDLAEAGDLITRIQIIPDMLSLNNAQSSVQSAKIELDDATQKLERGRDLHGRGAISQAELDRIVLDHNLNNQQHRTAVDNLQLVKEGFSRRTGNVSTQVRSTVSGMILSVEVKTGQSIVESNTFNEGTTIALVADMSDMIFEGNIDESEVGKIKEGMDLDITVGAMEGQRFPGVLEYISPKGVVADGAVQFEIRARIEPGEGVFIRAGSSANADIVLDRRDQVLSVREAVLQFDDGDAYVEIETREQVFERRDVEVGLSDGINIEILEGVDDTVRLKVQG